MTLADMKEETLTHKRLTALCELMVNNNDLINAEKIIDLFEKHTENELVIAFSGHFSAGKSSMINALFDKEVLPNSPIPTSTNVVKITSGGNTARIFFRDELPIEYQEPFDFEIVKQYCQDKNTIKRIEFNINKSILPNGCAIMDTPGIDAASDEDRLMTEDSLHLIDHMFYVMDYNHVQSEVNLTFLKLLQNKGIPTIIIVNQMDKHNEMEMTFQSFSDSFKQTLNKWRISPIATYYTSLKDDNITNNEFYEVKSRILSIFKTNQINTINIDHSLHQLIFAHKNFLRENLNEHFTTSTEKAEIKVSSAEIEKIQKKLNESNQTSVKLIEEFQRELNNTLKNAYLMPANLRDQAQLFLESQRRGFKVGLFSSKRKNTEVKRKRAEKFLQLLHQNIETSILWQLKNKLNNLLIKYNIIDTKLQSLVQRLSIEYTTKHLISLINKGATINGSYILNYTNNVADHIKNIAKTESINIFNDISTTHRAAIKKQVEKYQYKIDELEKRYKQQQKQINLQKQTEESLKLIDYTLTRLMPSINTTRLISCAVQKRNERIKQMKVMEARPITKGNQTQNIVACKSLPIETDTTNTAKKLLWYIEQTIQIINSIPGLQSIVADLRDKKDRLKNRTLTISLFGAFSAGKSSFANALIGGNVLPVSPNPTTAVITRISPITDKHQHGTVIIKLKTEQELVNDLLEITKELSPSTVGLPDLLEWIEANNIHQSDLLNKSYQSYLHAMIKGYDYSHLTIGQTKAVELEEFSSYVTDETKACYIGSVDLYYKSAITDQGITIVDTPGADSINARHTSVAFVYIKDTDAILYVTYYNHALSRADKDFLLQLGRVKESFELDKMFFILNAADLAKDDSELQLVTNYVKKELLKLNIRLPKIYPVSSKQSLDDKVGNKPLNGQMKNLESEFNQFIHNDLASLTVQSAILDIKRSFGAVNSYLTSIDLDETEKIAYRKKLGDIKAKQLKLTRSVNYNIYEKRIFQRIDTQLHYMKRRLSIRFNDLFGDSFNPTTISGTGKQAQSKLTRSLNELLDNTTYELLQELRAISLRVEKTINQLSHELYNSIAYKIKEIDKTITVPILENYDFTSPLFDQLSLKKEDNLFDQTFKRYRGTKSFFVNNERELMKDDIYALLEPLIDEHIAVNNKKMKQTYISQWNHTIILVQRRLKTSINNEFEQKMIMTKSKVDRSNLNIKQAELMKIINKLTRKDD